MLPDRCLSPWCSPLLIHYRASEAHAFITIFQKEESLKEQEIIESLRQGNEDFRKLYDEHHVLDGTLAEMDKKVYLTPEEEIERKKLQKQKLSKKDKMAEMVRDYKKSNPSN